ncbi:hypothetical protein ACWDZ5_23405, partial [Streptomyces sp. NPDC002996]
GGAPHNPGAHTGAQARPALVDECRALLPYGRFRFNDRPANDPCRSPARVGRTLYSALAALPLPRDTVAS